MLTRVCLLCSFLLLALSLVVCAAADAHARGKEDGVTRVAVVDMESYTEEDAMNLVTAVVENQVDVLGVLHYSSGHPKVASRIGLDLQRHKYHAEVDKKRDVLLASPCRLIRRRTGFLFQTKLGRQVFVSGHGLPKGAQAAELAVKVAAHRYMRARYQTVDPDYIFLGLDSAQNLAITYPAYMEAMVKTKGTLSDARIAFTDLKFPPVGIFRDATLRYFWWVLALVLLSLGILMLIAARSRRAPLIDE